MSLGDDEDSSHRSKHLSEVLGEMDVKVKDSKTAYILYVLCHLGCSMGDMLQSRTVKDKWRRWDEDALKVNSPFGQSTRRMEKCHRHRAN